MKKNLFLFTVLLGYSVSLFAQAKVTKPYQMFETTWMMPKRGHEKQFEKGVMGHNAKFHASGPHAARLSVITEGFGSDGWYVWSMGPTTYTDMDHQPNGNKEHDDDWTTNVDGHIEKYGESSLWRLQEDLSFTPANYAPANLDVWSIDIKPGMKYQFNDLMKKWKALWEAKKYPFALRVFNNDLFSGSGADASIVYSFDNYASFDLDIKWREDYEAMFGTGSWDNFWKAWNECVVSTDEHLRHFIK